MNKIEFEQFVLDNGKDILRFCRMITGSEEKGDELYQDTMLKLMEHLIRLDPMQNVKSYALSVSILLWKNKKKRYSVRKRIAPFGSLEAHLENGSDEALAVCSAEQIVLDKTEQEMVRSLVASLPEKYKVPLYLHYAADMKMNEISECLHIPANTVKTRMRKAKQLLKEKLEAIGYDR